MPERRVSRAPSARRGRRRGPCILLISESSEFRLHDCHAGDHPQPTKRSRVIWLSQESSPPARRFVRFGRMSRYLCHVPPANFPATIEGASPTKHHLKNADRRLLARTRTKHLNDQNLAAPKWSHPSLPEPARRHTNRPVGQNHPESDFPNTEPYELFSRTRSWARNFPVRSIQPSDRRPGRRLPIRSRHGSPRWSIHVRRGSERSDGSRTQATRSDRLRRQTI